MEKGSLGSFFVDVNNDSKTIRTNTMETFVSKIQSVHKLIKINSLAQAINNYSNDQDLADRISDWLEEWLIDDEDFNLDIESDVTVSVVDAWYDDEFNKFFIVIPDSAYVDAFSIARGVVNGLLPYLIPEEASYDQTTISFTSLFTGIAR
jgi:hypothetical protein